MEVFNSIEGEGDVEDGMRDESAGDVWDESRVAGGDWKGVHGVSAEREKDSEEEVNGAGGGDDGVGDREDVFTLISLIPQTSMGKLSTRSRVD